MKILRSLLKNYNFKKWASRGIAVLAIICLIVPSVAALGMQPESQPENPMGDVETQHSAIPLNSTNEVVPQLPEDQNKGDLQEDNDATPSGGEDGTGEQEGTNGGEEGENEGKGRNKDSKNRNNKDDGEEEQLFKTDIKQGDILPVPRITFTVTHFKEDYIPGPIQVEVNGKDFTDKCSYDKETGKYTLSLIQDKVNEITITFNYTSPDGKNPSDDEERTVEVTSGLILKETLKDEIGNNELSTQKQQLAFLAYLQKGEETFGASVKLNGKEIEADGGAKYQYTVQLKEGKNEIVIGGRHGEEAVKDVIYNINYEKPAEIWIDTDFGDQEVHYPELTIQAKAYVGDRRIALTITHTDEYGTRSLKDDGNGNYKAELNLGPDGEASRNVFTLTATDEAGEVSTPLKIWPTTNSEEVVVTYSYETEEDDDTWGDKEAPHIYIKDFDVNMTETRQTAITFGVTATDKYKRYISEKVKVINNGSANGVELLWPNEDKVTYQVQLEKGALNSIQISVSDYEGRTRQKLLLITQIDDGSAEDEQIGTVHVVMDANTAGVGTFIEADVPLMKNETAMNVLLRAFTAEYAGDDYAYGYTGDNITGQGFYLSSIQGPNLTGISLANAPADLVELVGAELEKQGTPWPTEIVEGSIDYLGEYSFGMGSGWMYSVDGTYPNVGFGDYRLYDGATLRVRYTLWYGKDIGGAGAMGEQTGVEDIGGGNWSKVW